MQHATLMLCVSSGAVVRAFRLQVATSLPSRLVLADLRALPSYPLAEVLQVGASQLSCEACFVSQKHADRAAQVCG